MRRKKTISVLIPVYIKENPVYLEECLNSIVNQTLLPDEVVICIDRSITENLQLVIEKFSTKLEIKKIIYSGHDKLGGSLSLGILNCKNDYIFRMDADDVCHKYRFEKMLKFFISNRLDVLGCWTREFNKDINDSDRVRTTPTEVTELNGNFRNPFNHPSVLLRKSSVIKAGNYAPCDGFEDWYLWLRMKKLKMRMKNLSDVLVYQRIGNDFEARRSGLSYIDNEFKALSLWRKEKLIKNSTFIVSVFTRTLVRFLPKKVLIAFYDKFLRTKVQY